MTHIHKSNGELLVSLNYKFELFKSNPSLYYPDWKPEMIATDVSYLHPIAENGQLREKTRLELVYEGTEKLGVGEIIVDEKIVSVPCPAELLKPEWIDYKWTETATEEDFFNASVDFYNSELEFAGKATTELACEIITDDMFSEVKSYMKSIDPYTQQSSRAFSVRRPSIFDRYK